MVVMPNNTSPTIEMIIGSSYESLGKLMGWECTVMRSTADSIACLSIS